MEARASRSTAADAFTSTDSTYVNDSWNENTADSGFPTEFTTPPGEAEKYTTVNYEPLSDHSVMYSDEVAVLNAWPSLHDVTSKTIDTSATMKDDVGQTRLTGKPETRPSSDYNSSSSGGEKEADGVERKSAVTANPAGGNRGSLKTSRGDSQHLMRSSQRHDDTEYLRNREDDTDRRDDEVRMKMIVLVCLYFV